MFCPILCAFGTSDDCHFCGKVGHSAEECHFKQPRDKKSAEDSADNKRRPAKRQKLGGENEPQRPLNCKCVICDRVHRGQACPRASGDCFYCGLVGHFIRDCRIKKVDDLRRAGSTPQPPQQ